MGAPFVHRWLGGIAAGGVLLALGLSPAQAQTASIPAHPAASPCAELLTTPQPALPAGGSTDAGLSSALAVLRRPMATSDAPPGGVVLGDNLAGILGVYDPDGVRLLQTSGSSSYYLVPGKTVPLTVSARCLRALPPSLRASLRTQQHPAQSAYCLLGANSTAIDQALLCGLVAQFGRGYSIYEGVHGSRRPNLLAGLVPDGVTSAALSFRNAGTVTIPVSNNLFLGTEPAALSRPLTQRELHSLRRLRARVLQRVPLSVTWLGPRGEVIQRLLPPPGLVRQIEAQVQALNALLGARKTKPKSNRRHVTAVNAASAWSLGFAVG